MTLSSMHGHVDNPVTCLGLKGLTKVCKLQGGSVPAPQGDGPGPLPLGACLVVSVERATNGTKRT